jgi:adenine phosphoribosyltransferase
MTNEELKSLIIEVPDFPKPGVQFKDLSCIFRDHLYETAFKLCSLFRQLDFEYIAGIESRGFIIASAMATQMSKKFLAIRKEGKLPSPKLVAEYEYEYGKGQLEMQMFDNMHKTFLHTRDRILLIDDVLATGGTLEAAANLTVIAGYQLVGVGAIVDLSYLNKFDYHGLKCKSLIQYEQA